MSTIINCLAISGDGNTVVYGQGTEVYIEGYDKI
jgi:hypothetical protein